MIHYIESIATVSLIMHSVAACLKPSSFYLLSMFSYFCSAWLLPYVSAVTRPWNNCGDLHCFQTSTCNPSIFEKQPHFSSFRFSFEYVVTFKIHFCGRCSEYAIYYILKSLVILFMGNSQSSVFSLNWFVI